MKLPLEVSGPDDKHIARDAKIAAGAVPGPAPQQTRRRIIWHNHHQIVITIRSSPSSGDGTEEVDRFRVVRLHETTHNLAENRIIGCWGVQICRAFPRHGEPQSSLPQGVFD